MPARKLPPKDDLVQMSRSGMTHREIAEQVSRDIGEPVTRAAVTLALSRAGVPHQNLRYEDEIPWTVSSEHINEWPLRMLRLLGRSNRGLELTDEQHDQLTRWLRRMHANNAVVAYCPTAMPGCYYILADESADEPNGIPIRPRILSSEDVAQMQ